ncbi:MAG: hypothetical protein A3F80_07300 [Candidatus Melainabacteria bacterium RIFCSPLOWO2_12_FULL_35_11]|nr:MAG: hypothetical protein A3F80_07300 [Candidatus Melainabacteria bacterium RIFCSPLOWO2_12_FULL_35_11]
MFSDYVDIRRGAEIKTGLERIKACLNYLGNPQKKYKSVLITGTNGKGSVTFYLSNLACKFTDYKIGRYISPHLILWNERFVINEMPVDGQFLEDFSYDTLKKIESFENQSNVKLTTFEVYTVIAFYLFAKEKVDIAFWEIGMGGRLDATNVVDSEEVLCSVITNVSMEHTDYLGDGIEQIAHEKAGIIKENNHAVTGASGAALDVIRKEAKNLNVNLISPGFADDILYSEKNIKIALAAWEVISQKIKTRESSDKKEFLKSLQFPGRFQLLKEHKILLDGAHNPAGAVELRKMLDNYCTDKKIVYILGILDKDFKGFINNLISKNSLVVCVEPKSKRATSKELLSDYLTEHDCKSFVCKDLKEAIDTARKFEHDLIVITGSLYLVGEALELVTKWSQWLTCKSARFS